MNKRVLLKLISFFVACSFIMSGCSDDVSKKIDSDVSALDFGEKIAEYEGNENITPNVFSSEQDMLASMTEACENEKYKMMFSLDSMSVAVVDKNSGKIFTTNPFNSALDENYSGTVASELDSQIVLTYLDDNKELKDLYSSTDCANFGQYNVKVYENGICFELSIGEEKESIIAPVVLSEKRYKEIFEKSDKKSKGKLDVYYSFFAEEDLEDSGVYDLYPDLKAQNIYYCTSELTEREKNNLAEVFEKAEYTAEKYNSDITELGLNGSTNVYPNFKLNLCYILSDDGITVSVPNETIVGKSEYPLLRISLLPYFGADTPSNDASGYLLIPDGSGAIINMNQNVPDRRTVITGKVYGDNLSSLPKTEAVERTEQYYLPVFGCVRNNGTGTLGIITSGDANAEITAHLGRPNGNFYAVNPEFIVADYEKYTRVSVVETAWSTKTMYLYDKNKSTDDFSVKYVFLDGENANYSAMAKICNEYIFGTEKVEKAKRNVLHFETLGSALVTKSILGFEYMGETVFTEYSQNMGLLSELEKQGVTDVSLLLRGWQKGGLDAPVSNGYKPSSDLGGKGGMKKLVKYCDSNNIPLALENNISFAWQDKNFDNFSLKANSARTMELKYAKNASLSPDTMKFDKGSYIVTPCSYNKYLNKIVSEFNNNSLGEINLGDLGNALVADYSADRMTNRSQAKSYIKTALSNAEYNKFSFDGANAYILPFADNVNNITLINSGFSGESSSVPFLQMVLGDNVICNSEAVNLSEDIKTEVLKCAETGTTPSFLLTYDNTSELKNTNHTKYYSVDFGILKDDIVKSYDSLKEVVSATDGTCVVNHKILEQGVTVSTYKNGAKVYVNYTDVDYTKDGITVLANSYTVKR